MISPPLLALNYFVKPVCARDGHYWHVTVCRTMSEQLNYRGGVDVSYQPNKDSLSPLTLLSAHPFVIRPLCLLVPRLAAKVTCDNCACIWEHTASIFMVEVGGSIFLNHVGILQIHRAIQPRKQMSMNRKWLWWKCFCSSKVSHHTTFQGPH